MLTRNDGDYSGLPSTNVRERMEREACSSTGKDVGASIPLPSHSDSENKGRQTESQKRRQSHTMRNLILAFKNVH